MLLFGLTLSFAAEEASSTDNNLVMMPPGCECVDNEWENGCKTFTCNCNCDLIYGTCDLGCCCDPECSADEVDWFSDECSSGNEQELKARTCSDTDPALEKVNNWRPVRMDEVVEECLEDLLCISKNNNPTKYNLYDHVEYLDPVSTFSMNGIGDKLRDYSSHYSTIGITENSFTAGSNSLYEIGDVLPVVDEDKFYRGSLRLPAVDDGGFCQDLDVIHFGRSRKKRRCSRVVSDLSSSCTTSFNVDQYVTNLFVGSSRLSSLSGETNLETDPSFVRVSYGSLEDGDGNIVDVATIAPSITVWDEEATVCKNALKALTYNILYNDSGGIEQVTADVQVSDLQVNVGTAVHQQFAVKFMKVTSNQTLRVKSGNPGYIFGAPVLSGVSIVDSSGGKESVQMTTPSSGRLSTMNAGNCELISTTGLVVGFGEDVSVGCLQPLNKSDMADLCTSVSPNHPLLTSISVNNNTVYLPIWLDTTPNLLVGIFGNADPHDRTHWLSIHESIAVKSRHYFADDGRCEGLPTGVHYKFLWTYVGGSSNPQAKILSAQKEFEHMPLIHQLREPNQKQNHAFTTTVSWTYFENTDSGSVTPPPPNLLFTLPDDAFYPFVSSISYAPRTKGTCCIAIITTFLFILLNNL